VETRCTDATPPSVLITSLDAAYLAAPGEQRIRAVVRDPATIRTLIGFFDCQWEAAHPAPSQVSSAEADVLRLLAGGWTQDRIARELKIPLRTLARRINDAYARLGATSAFQAGYHAHQRGLL
jgi:DNA-binding NarL/FixJ family response regulator